MGGAVCCVVCISIYCDAVVCYVLCCLYCCKIIETNLSSVAYYIIKPKTDTNTNNNKDTIKHISKETNDLLTLSELLVAL